MHRTVAFTGDGDDFPDPFEVLDRFLDLDQHTLFHIRGRGPQVGHRDGDVIGLHLRLDFLGDGERGDGATNDQDRHQQVGGHRVVGEPGDQTGVSVQPWRTGLPVIRIRG